MDFSGVPGKGIVFSYPSPAEDQPRTKAPAPPGKDTGMYVILLLRMKYHYNDIIMRMLRSLLIGFVGKDKKAEIFGPQTAPSGGESLVLFPCPTRIHGAHERTADTPVDILSPGNPLGPGLICTAPDGDVILEVREDSRSFQFRVASQILCVASPYFRDMPGPGSTFKKACDLRGGTGSNPEPWSIVIRGDNPNALTILLYSLHFRSEKVPRAVSFDGLWELAILCDKFGCVSAMKPWITLWTRIPPQHKDNFSECLVKWVYMAYVFELDDLFEKVTTKIILEGRYYGRTPSDDHFAMPSYISLSDPRFLIPKPVICKSISSTDSP